MVKLFLVLLGLVATTYAFWEPNNDKSCEGSLDKDVPSRININSFDGQDLKITGAQKTFITERMVDTSDECKFRLRMVTKMRGKQLTWHSLNFGFGYSSNGNPQKFLYNWKFLANDITSVKRRGRGHKKDEDKGVSLPFTEKDHPGLAMAFAPTPDGTIKVRSEVCTFAIDWTPGDNVFKFFYLNDDKLSIGPEMGFCGNMDTIPTNDYRTCKHTVNGIKVNSLPLDTDISEEVKWDMMTFSCNKANL